MKTLLLLLGALCALCGPSTADDRPNILFIYADDLGWKDVGYQGTDYYETPRIDALAKSGMVFTDGYSSAGNCQPARACLLSGQYTPRHHVFAVSSTLRGPKNLMRLVPIPNREGPGTKEATMAVALKAAGYATGIFGKWHLDGPADLGGSDPDQQGFDVVLQRNGKGGSVSEDPKAIFSITRAAAEFMESNVKKNQPFFAYVPHHAIHTGLQARQQTLDKFKSKPPGKQHTNPLYAACTYDLDTGVGMLLDKLDELKIADKTLVVFTSDNGGTGQSLQEPLRGNKGSYHEGGIREPFIIRWPGVTKPGSSCPVPVIQIDLFPTFLDAAGAKTPDGKILDGESLRPLCAGADALQRKAIFWHFPGYLDRPVTRGRDPVFRTRPVSVIRKGDWKLYLYHEEWVLDGGRESLATNKAVELYNLRDDIGERHDLANADTARRDELLDDLLAWTKATNAPIPSERNPAYDPDQAAKEKTKKARKK